MYNTDVMSWLKSFWGTTWRILGFFTVWVLLSSVGFASEAALEPSFLQGNEALERLWLELIPLIAVIGATAVMARLLDRKLGWPKLAGSLGKETVYGLVFGLVWLLAVVGVLVALGVISFSSAAQVPSLWPVWLLAAALNVAMQEYLVRGYIFSRLNSRSGAVAAIIVTTLLLVGMHGGEGGLLGVLNVAAAAVVFSLILLKTGSLWAVIVAHVGWNLAGGIGLGVLSLGGVYPNFMSPDFQSASWLIQGGTIEASAVTLIISLLLAACLGWSIRRRAHQV